MELRFPYQGKAEPVFVPPVEAVPGMDSWFQVSPVPLTPKFSRPDLQSVTVLEPSLFILQNLDWLQDFPQPQAVTYFIPIETVFPLLEMPLPFDWHPQDTITISRITNRPPTETFAPFEIPTPWIPYQLSEQLPRFSNPISPSWIGVTEPSLFIVPNFDWWRALEHPVTRQLQTQQELLTVFDPSLFQVVIPSLDGWWQPTQVPLPPKQQVANWLWSGVTEPSLFVVPSFDWWVPLDRPVLPRNRVAHTLSEGILNPTLFEIRIPFDWFIPAEIPVQPRLRTAHSLWLGVTEPSLFVIPTMDTWYQLQSQFIEQIVISWAETSILEPTLFVTPGVNPWLYSRQQAQIIGGGLK